MRFVSILFAALALVMFVHTADAANSFSINRGEVTQGVGMPAGDNSLAPVSFTQSADPASVVQFAAVSCNAGGLHTDNSYVRRFDLDADHGIASPLQVLSVDSGVEVSAGAGGGPQPVEVRLYTIAAGAPLLFANLNLIGLDPFAMPGNGSVDLTVVNMPAFGLVADPVGGDLVVELFTPNGQNDGNSFFVGANSSGQTAPTYLAAVDCGVAEPTDTAALGFPDMHWVLTVNGDTLDATPVEESTWAQVKNLYR